ncbi:MAG TPA: hypothetical protein VGK73_37385 [Polyangiaceae bacterium]
MMSRMLSIAVVLLCCAGPAHAKECDYAWAVSLLKATAKEKKAEAVQTIAKCPSGKQLLQQVSQVAKVPTRRGGSGPVQPVATKDVYLDVDAWAALLARQRADALTCLKDIETRGGFESCDPAVLQACLAEVGDYLEKVREKGVPERTLRDSGALFEGRGDRPGPTPPPGPTPAMLLAESLARHLHALSEEKKAALGAKFGELKQALEAKTAAETLLLLLEHPERLSQLYQDPVFLTPNRLSVSGRPVIAVTDYSTLGDAACSPELAGELDDALVSQRPHGSKFYGSEYRQSPDVCITTLLVDSGEGSECRAPAGQQCIRAHVRGWTESGGGKPRHTCPPAAGSAPPTFERFTSSRPFPKCGKLDRGGMRLFAAEVIESFAVRLDDAVSVDQAKLVRPGCVTVASKVDRPAWSDHATNPNLRGIRVSGSGWSGFEQELSETLRLQQSVFGEVNAGNPGALSLTWSVKQPPGKALPAEATLTLHSTLPRAPEDASFVFTPRKQAGCELTPVAFQQTVATAAALQLTRLFFQQRNERDELPCTKDWRYAPLGLLLAGLPQVVDGPTCNDTRGAILAGTDLALLSTAAVLVLLSVDARNDFSATGDDVELDRANALLTAGFWVGGAVLVPRAISVAW